MKIDLKYVIAVVFMPILTLILGVYLGYVGSFKVQKYAIEEHERLKRIEKEALKQKIERENQILIGRLEEDFQVFKDSVTVVFAIEKKQFEQDHGLLSPGSSGLRAAMEGRFDAERNRIIAAKRKEVDRRIEDLQMKLDF
jgi:hypothetical protein